MSLLLRSRLSRLMTGWTAIVVGAAVAPTPVPLGLLMIVAGLCLLARDSKLLRHLIRRQRRRWPVASARADAVKHRLPAILRHVVEATDPHRAPRFRRRGRPSSP